MLRFLFLTYFILIVTSILNAEPHWGILNPYPVAGDIVAIDFVNDNVGFLLTDGGLMRMTSDGGNHWTSINDPFTEANDKAIDFLNDENGWVLGGNDDDHPYIQLIYYTEDGGENWNNYRIGSEEIPAELSNLRFFSADNGWAVGGYRHEDVVYPTVFQLDRDNNWEGFVHAEGTGSRLKDVFFINQRMGWVTGQFGYTAYMEDGINWQISERVTEFDLHSVHFTDMMNGFAVGGNLDNGVILKTVDGGESWELQEDHPAETRITAVRTLGGLRAIAMSTGWGNFPARIITTHNGRDWSETLVDPDHSFISMSTVDEAVWIGGNDGYIIASPNGRDWNVLSRNILPGSVYDIYFLNEQIGWATGSDGILLATRNGGSSWNEIETGSELAFYNVVFINEVTGWLTGQYSTELRTDDGGRNWHHVNIGDGDVNLITFIGNVGYAAHGTSVSVSHNGGENWETTDVIQGQRVPAIALSVPEPGVAYIASPGDSLRRTLDSGDNWHAIEAPFVGCYSASFISRDLGWVVAASPRGGARIYITENGGQTWWSGHRFNGTPGGIHFIGRNYGWVWENPGRLLTTVDGGRNWQDMDLRVDRILRGIHVEGVNRLWICGDGGLIARWGENWLSVPDKRQEQPDRFLLSPAWPNPTNGTANLLLTIREPGSFSSQLFDYNGRLVQTWNDIYSAAGSYPLSVQLKSIPAGCYWLMVDYEDRRVQRKIILIK